MAEQYYFVCMCLCYQRWTHEPEEDVKKNIEWTFSICREEENPEKIFYVFIDFTSSNIKVSPTNPTWPHAHLFDHPILLMAHIL